MYFFISCTLPRPKSRNRMTTLTHDSIKRRVLMNERLLGFRMITIYCLGVYSPKNRHTFSHSREISAKMKFVNDFLAVRNTLTGFNVKHLLASTQIEPTERQVKTAKSLFKTECLSSRYYIDLICVFNLTIAWATTNFVLMVDKSWELQYQLNIRS